jgi:hypothetical protein
VFLLLVPVQVQGEVQGAMPVGVGAVVVADLVVVSKKKTRLCHPQCKLIPPKQQQLLLSEKRKGSVLEQSPYAKSESTSGAQTCSFANFPFLVWSVFFSSLLSTHTNAYMLYLRVPPGPRSCNGYDDRYG